jgi:hypothetical protein
VAKKSLPKKAYENKNDSLKWQPNVQVFFISNYVAPSSLEGFALA